MRSIVLGSVMSVSRNRTNPEASLVEPCLFPVVPAGRSGEADPPPETEEGNHVSSPQFPHEKVLLPEPVRERKEPPGKPHQQVPIRVQIVVANHQHAGRRQEEHPSEDIGHPGKAVDPDRPRS